MAVQQTRKSRSKRDMRRAHDSLGGPTLSEDRETGELHRRHHMTPDGFYRGKQYIVSEKTETVEDEE
jgi:large subunit ribosomal protein L32